MRTGLCCYTFVRTILVSCYSIDSNLNYHISIDYNFSDINWILSLVINNNCPGVWLIHSLSHSKYIVHGRYVLWQETSRPSGVTIHVKERPSSVGLMHDEFCPTKRWTLSHFEARGPAPHKFLSTKAIVSAMQIILQWRLRSYYRRLRGWSEETDDKLISESVRLWGSKQHCIRTSLIDKHNEMKSFLNIWQLHRCSQNTCHWTWWFIAGFIPFRHLAWSPVIQLFVTKPVLTDSLSVCGISLSSPKMDTFRSFSDLWLSGRPWDEDVFFKCRIFL